MTVSLRLSRSEKEIRIKAHIEPLDAVQGLSLRNMHDPGFKSKTPSKAVAKPGN